MCHSVSSLQNDIFINIVCVCMCVCVLWCGDYCSSTVGDHVMWSGVYILYNCCSSLKSCSMIVHYQSGIFTMGVSCYVTDDRV